MANYVGIELSRAIRNRAYAAGAVTHRAKRVDFLQAALAAAIKDLGEARAILADADQALQDISRIDAGSIRPIMRFRKSGLYKYGDLSRAIVQILKEANAPVQTPDIITGVSGALGLPLHTKSDWAVTRRMVVKQLQKYARKGAIQRLHDLKKPEVGSWLWIGL